MDNPTGTILRIGAWQLNVAANEISKSGNTVRLDPRLMRLLLCLADRPGEIVSTEALLKAVWSDVVVTPDSVYQAIASLRRSFGDDPKKPEYIATIARVGYRLIAPVGPANTSPELACEPESARGKVEPASAPVTSSVRSHRPWLVAMGLAIALLALVTAFLLGNRAASSATATLAVLPFVDLTSQSMDQEYFADGMTEELIDRLSQIPGLRISSASASFYYKSKNLPPSRVGAELGVRYLLDGSVRQSGPTLRVTARLLRAQDGFVLWTQTYERNSSEPLKVQDDIAHAVSQSLKKSVLPGA